MNSHQTENEASSGASALDAGLGAAVPSAPTFGETT